MLLHSGRIYDIFFVLSVIAINLSLSLLNINSSDAVLADAHCCTVALISATPDSNLLTYLVDVGTGPDVNTLVVLQLFYGLSFLEYIYVNYLSRLQCSQLFYGTIFSRIYLCKYTYIWLD